MEGIYFNCNPTANCSLNAVDTITIELQTRSPSARRLHADCTPTAIELQSDCAFGLQFYCSSVNVMEMPMFRWMCGVNRMNKLAMNILGEV
jgi:hypothetical protein